MRSLVLLLGCSTAPPVTQVVLDVEVGDVSVGRDIDTIHVMVGSSATTPDDRVSTGVPLCAALPASGCHDLPLTVALVPGPNSPGDSLRVEVQGKLHGDGSTSTLRLRDAASFHFAQGQTQRLTLALAASCLDDPLHCADSDQSCGSQGCYAAAPSPASNLVGSDLGPFTVTR
jgi:hypothetical protein